VRAVAKHDAVGVRTQALIYSIFDELRDHVSSFLAPIIKHEPAGALEVAQVWWQLLKQGAMRSLD
jgi:hypothetical protein